MTQENLHVIVGLGVTGMSCASYLSRVGLPFAVTDSRQTPPQADVFHKIFPGIPLSLGQLDEDLLSRAAVIVLSPGVSLQESAIAKQISQGKKVIGDIELFARVADKPVIAITGTNAKSTVTTLVGDMLTAAGYKPGVGGNLGVPVLDLLQGDHDVYVLEISSFQLETIHSLQPAVAAILNISPDHLDRHQGFENYVAAKQRIYEKAKIAVSNLDDTLTRPKHIEQQYFFSLIEQGDRVFSLLRAEGRDYLVYNNEKLISTDELPVQGRHFQANALAALAIAHAFGLTNSIMVKALASFQGLPHRCQFIRKLNGISFYNDSKGTNVGATLASISGLGVPNNENIILIAGGVGKGADFAPLLPAVKQYVHHVILLGEAAETLSDVLANAAQISFANNMKDAVETAAKLAKDQDTVLLSPACASFDMFENFEHRGDLFIEAVRSLQGE